VVGHVETRTSTTEQISHRGWGAGRHTFLKTFYTPNANPMLAALSVKEMASVPPYVESAHTIENRVILFFVYHVFAIGLYVNIRGFTRLSRSLDRRHSLSGCFTCGAPQVRKMKAES
jgi:hypothetical protein